MNIRDRIKELRRVPADQLQPNPKNWRKHPEAQANALRGVLAEVGIASAVLARETPEGGLMLIDGHLRTETLHNAEIPVLVLDVTEEEADKILATFDPLGAMAESDADALRALLEDVETGSQELADMLTALAEDAGVLDGADAAEIVEDEVPEPAVDPITKPGDLWILGDHRLLCGDSTKAEDVERLMGGAKADLCFTSPPYNAGDASTGAYRNGSANRTDFKKMYNTEFDNMSSAEYQQFLLRILHQTERVLEDSGLVLWNVSYNAKSRREYGLVIFSENNPLPVQETIVWDKKIGMNVAGDNIYSRSCELVFLLSRTNKYKSNQNGGVYWNVWRITARDGDNMQNGHGASFPVALPSIGIQQHTQSGDAVYEPFCGSGTTLIAAEQLGRKCYGMEISPQYCDVIVKRWETLTGRQAERRGGR